jgi:hypothetical protein
MILSKYSIDYEAVLSEARAHGATNPALILQERLPSIWRDAYVKTVTHEPNLVRFRCRTFEYICDVYSQLEMTGAVPYDQTIADRVIGVLGKSSRAQQDRDVRRMRIELAEEFAGTERDDGHFMAHCIGGGLELNVFSQERHLNRGWSRQGKIYRKMEDYCYQQPGTFCFSRPIYADGSNVPRWLEFGLLKADHNLWVELFDN